jgi:hypothetical protein
MAAFIKLTDPDGRYVWVGKQWVTKVSVPPRDQYPANALTLIAMGPNLQAVLETPEAVIALLEAV